MMSQLSVSVLNHIFRQNSWCLERLSRFAGKVVRFDIAPFSLSYLILPDGQICRAEPPDVATVVCEIPPSLLPRLLLHDELAYADINSSGEQALLTEIFYLFRNLRPDAAMDLSPLTGDVAAERIVQALRYNPLGTSILNLAQATTEYFTEERPLLAKPQRVNEFMQQVDTLRDDIARLEQRITRLYDKESS
jgi:ubiquinone biosynthesis protein UbiJ